MRVRKLYSDGGEIASTILQQLGGANRLHAMTGAYNFINRGNGLSFKIKNQKANYIKITLTSMDLYDVEVGRIRGNTYKVVDEGNGLYADQLKPFIEKATGMYLSFGRFEKGGETGQMYLELAAMPDYDDYEDDYKWDTDFRHIEEYKVPISSFEEASRIVTEFIEDNDLGSSNFTGGDIFQNNVQIAKVGYNGKVYKAEHYFDGKQKRTRFEERLFENGGMITITSDDGEVLKYKIDTDEKSIEVDEATKKYLSDIVLVMDRDFRKLNNTYIFWYDEMSDKDIEELEELFKINLTKYSKGGKLKSNPDDEWECSECGKTQGRHDMWFEGDLCEKCHEHSKEEFLEDMAELHKDIKDITLKDGTKITHDDLAKANNVMAKGGETHKKFFRDRTAKLREPFNKGFEGLAKATGHESLTKMATGGNVWDEDLNVYTLVSSKEYFGSDTASDKRRWFRRNGRGLTRDQAKRMAQDYIDRYGKERVYIGNIRHYR